MKQRSAVCVVVSLFFLLLPAASVAAPSFTLEQVMSAPFASDLEAAPEGGRFLWVANREGRRNIWVAEPGDGAYVSHRVTADDADDGIEIGHVSWAVNGERIVYVRGGDLEFPHRPPVNPALLPSGVEQEIWIVAADGGDARKLAAGRAPHVSPDGSTIAFIKDDQIWTLKLDDAEAEPVQLFHGRGRPGSLAWSPDGASLAFASNRGDHGFIGLYSFAQQSLRYLDPSTEIDREPVWSPDGRSLAFLRIPPDTAGVEFKPRRKGTPWSIRVVDVSSGEGREIWRANEGPGSVFRHIESDHQLFWTAGDRVVFPWEGDGWLHLYSVPVGGGEATTLTPGSFEVDFVALGHDRRTLVYSSNQGDIDRRHLWEVAPDGGTPRQLTRGDGLEVIPVLAPDGTLAVLHADARLPLRPAVVTGDGELRDLAPQMIPTDFPAAKLAVPRQVIIDAADGMKIHAQLFLPASSAAGAEHPAVVFFHGGSQRQMLLGWHYMSYYSNAYAMNQYLASLGYVVLSVNYRSGIGYGLDFREAVHYGADGASEFNDVEGAGLYLRGRPDVDGSHIGAWGGSYGGYLTALALARASDLFAAGVDLHGVHDWNLEMKNWEPDYDPHADPEAARIAWESSPLASVKTWRSPVLLIQGDDDRNVQFSNTVRLAAALRAQGTPFEECVFPDEVHGFLLHRSWLKAYNLAADFFDRHLRPAPAAP